MWMGKWVKVEGVDEHVWMGGWVHVGTLALEDGGCVFVSPRKRVKTRCFTLSRPKELNDQFCKKVKKTITMHPSRDCHRAIGWYRKAAPRYLKARLKYEKNPQLLSSCIILLLPLLR